MYCCKIINKGTFTLKNAVDNMWAYNINPVRVKKKELSQNMNLNFISLKTGREFKKIENIFQ